VSIRSGSLASGRLLEVLDLPEERQAYRAERDARAGRVTFLVEELKTARTATDAYRQAVRNWT
jgi:hypothetical protein